LAAVEELVPSKPEANVEAARKAYEAVKIYDN